MKGRACEPALSSVDRSDTTWPPALRSAPQHDHPDRGYMARFIRRRPRLARSARQPRGPQANPCLRQTARLGDRRRSVLGQRHPLPVGSRTGSRRLSRSWMPYVVQNAPRLYARGRCWLGGQPSALPSQL